MGINKYMALKDYYLTTLAVCFAGVIGAYSLYALL